MNTEKTNAIRQQLEAYKEGWNGAYESAQRNFWDVQERVTVGLNVFRMVESLNAIYRESVSRGIEQPDVDVEETIKDGFRMWAGLCHETLPSIARTEKEYGPVQGVEEFRASAQVAEQALEEWVSPAASQAAGLHLCEFSAEERTTFDRLIQNGQARLRIKPRGL